MSFLTRISLFLLTILTFNLIHVSTAIPFNNTAQRRELFSLDSYHGPNLDRRSLFNVDSIPDADQKEALRQGLRDAIEMARVVLQHFQDKRHEAKAKMWLGAGLTEIRTTINDVFKNFIGSDVNNEGADVLGDVTLDPNDYWHVPEEGGKLFCDIVKPDGSTGTAYFKPKKGVPYMHYCPCYFDRVDANALLADSCSSIADHMNTDTMARQFQGGNVFHEFMHYPEITLKPVGGQVGDYAYGAWDCFNLKDGKLQKKDSPDPLFNADSWTWYALHIYLTEVCGKEFSNPRGPQDN